MAGMGDESIDLSKLGTALFAFGFVLVIGLTIFTVGKSITNSGADKVTTQLDTISQSEFDDYDQQTVLGTKVKAAYSNFEGKALAIIVATRSMVDNVNNAGNCPGLDISGTPGQTAVQQINLTGLAAINSAGNSVNTYWGIDYNAVLKDDSLTMDNGAFITPDTFLTDPSGSIQYYNQVSNMKKQGTAEYIPTGAKYMSTLIKDSTGSTCGVVFVQTSAN